MAKSARSTGSGKTSETPAAEAEAAGVAALSYEQALGELESLIQQVEEGTLSLEDGIRSHRRAVLLLRHCERILDAAQTQVDQVAGRDLPAAPDEPV